MANGERTFNARLLPNTAFELVRLWKWRYNFFKATLKTEFSTALKTKAYVNIAAGVLRKLFSHIKISFGYKSSYNNKSIRSFVAIHNFSSIFRMFRWACYVVSSMSIFTILAICGYILFNHIDFFKENIL